MKFIGQDGAAALWSGWSDDEAQSFYEHYHFTPVRNRARRLVMKVSTAAKALGERWREYTLLPNNVDPLHR